MNYTYVPINRIFAKLTRDLGADFNEGDVIEWTGEALEAIGARRIHEEAVAFIEVKNHQCELPKNLHQVIQVARNMNWSPCEAYAPKAIEPELTQCKAQCVPNECKCCCDDADAVWVDCNGTPIVDYELAYYRPYYDLQMEYYGWSNTRHYTQNFAPLRLASSTMFNSIVCSNVNPGPYLQKCSDEYTIIQGKYIRTSFKTGGIAVSYMRALRDKETGYPMIPDDISFTTAIVKYITMKKAERDFYANRQGAEARIQKAEADWQWYCKQCSNKDMMPYGIDEHQNLLEQRSKMIPNHNKYFGFFGSNATTHVGGHGRRGNGDDQIIINNNSEGQNLSTTEW